MNTTVGVVRAFDLDEDINGEIFFDIISGDTDLFSLVTVQTDPRQTFSAMLINNQVSLSIHLHYFIHMMVYFKTAI